MPKNAKETPGTSKAAKRTNAPAQTVTWTRLLNFTAGRRTHTMACAHSELSTGHCGRRIGTKIFQDDSCSPSTRQPNDRFEEWCSRKNKVRSLHQPAAQRRRHASAGCSQGSFIYHFTADWGFQRMFSHSNSSCTVAASLPPQTRTPFRPIVLPSAPDSLPPQAPFRPSLPAAPASLPPQPPFRPRASPPCRHGTALQMVYAFHDTGHA